MSSILPEMTTPQVVSRLAQRDPPRSRLTIRPAERPVRRSLYVELDAVQRESLYYQHNGGPATTASEGETWYANVRTRTHRNEPFLRRQCDSLTVPVPATG